MLPALGLGVRGTLCMFPCRRSGWRCQRCRGSCTSGSLRPRTGCHSPLPSTLACRRRRPSSESATTQAQMETQETRRALAVAGPIRLKAAAIAVRNNDGVMLAGFGQLDPPLRGHRIARSRRDTPAEPIERADVRGRVGASNEVGHHRGHDSHAEIAKPQLPEVVGAPDIQGSVVHQQQIVVLPDRDVLWSDRHERRRSRRLVAGEVREEVWVVWEQVDLAVAVEPQHHLPPRDHVSAFSAEERNATHKPDKDSTLCINDTTHTAHTAHTTNTTTATATTRTGSCKTTNNTEWTSCRRTHRRVWTRAQCRIDVLVPVVRVIAAVIPQLASQIRTPREELAVLGNALDGLDGPELRALLALPEPAIAVAGIARQLVLGAALRHRTLGAVGGDEHVVERARDELVRLEHHPQHPEAIKHREPPRRGHAANVGPGTRLVEGGLVRPVAQGPRSL
eukprot:483010-Rhodomonas_salina.1